MVFKELIIDSNFKLYNPLFPGPKTHTHFTKYFANQKYFCSSKGISFVSIESLTQCYNSQCILHTAEPTTHEYLNTSVGRTDVLVTAAIRSLRVCVCVYISHFFILVVTYIE